MLQNVSPVDSLILLPDNELQHALAQGDFPNWVDEYVEYIISGDGNKYGDYFTLGDGDFGSRLPSFPSNRYSVDRDSSHRKHH